MKYYAGIGSRRTPKDILNLMERVARWLSDQGWILRTGDAVGADSAFISGAQMSKIVSYTADDVHIPDQTTETSHSTLAYNSLIQFHPNSEACSRNEYVARLMARNFYQIVGFDTEIWYWTERMKARQADGSPKFWMPPKSLRIQGIEDYKTKLPVKFWSKFVVCWTPDGARTHEETSRDTGGTGQAIRIASHLGIPVFNLKRAADRENIEKKINS